MTSHEAPDAAPEELQAPIASASVGDFLARHFTKNLPAASNGNANEVAREMAESIAAGPTQAFSLACQIIDRASGGASLADVLAAEAVAQAAAFATDDLREGLAAFRERRTATFRGE